MVPNIGIRLCHTTMKTIIAKKRRPAKKPPEAKKNGYISPERMKKIFAGLDRLFPSAQCAAPQQSFSASGCHNPLGTVHRRARQQSDARAVRQISRPARLRRIGSERA